MASGGFYRGISVDQDPRFRDKDQQLLQSTLWPSLFAHKVSISKVKTEALAPWISNRITHFLGVEDDILSGLVMGYLHETPLDPKRITLNLTPFLETKASEFVEELWKMLISAQESTLGIPMQLIEERKAEIRKEKEEIEVKIEQIRRLEELKVRQRSRSRSVSSESRSSNSSGESRRRRRRR